MGGRRELSRRELLLVAVGACLLSAVMNWPLILNLGTDIPKDLGDPLVQAWQAAWGGHALAHQPLQIGKGGIREGIILDMLNGGVDASAPVMAG